MIATSTIFYKYSGSLTRRIRPTAGRGGLARTRKTCLQGGEAEQGHVAVAAGATLFHKCRVADAGQARHTGTVFHKFHDYLSREL